MQQWIQETGLQEILITAHWDHIPMVDNGSQTIDGIFASHSLTAIRSGYLAFGSFPSNHRCLWVDFNTSSIFGFRTPILMHPKARRLQCSMPAVKRKWQQDYLHSLRTRSLLTRQFNLEKEIQGPLTIDQQ